MTHLVTLHSTRRTPASASNSCPFSDLQLEHDELSTNGLRSGLEHRELSATAEPDLGGRTARGLQSRHNALSETFHDKSSDWAHLGRDPVGTPDQAWAGETRASTWTGEGRIPLSVL